MANHHILRHCLLFDLLIPLFLPSVQSPLLALVFHPPLWTSSPQIPVPHHPNSWIAPVCLLLGRVVVSWGALAPNFFISTVHWYLSSHGVCVTVLTLRPSNPRTRTDCAPVATQPTCISREAGEINCCPNTAVVSLWIWWVCTLLLLPLSLKALKRNPETCACGGAQTDHGRETAPPILSQLPPTQAKPWTPTLAPVLGPTRLVVDSSPITHPFPPDQQLSATAGKRQTISIGRSTTRNSGGIPSPALPTAHRQTRPTTALSHQLLKPLPGLMVIFLPICISPAAASGLVTSLAFQMGQPQVQDLPPSFLQQFQVKPGADFNSFLSRFKENNLLFTVGANDNIRPAITKGLEGLIAEGAPTLPRPSHPNSLGGPDWEFLSCKLITRRAKAGQDEDRRFLEIKRPTTPLAPVDYNVNTITKKFGYKDTLRQDPSEPDKFVFIGTQAQLVHFHPLSNILPIGARYPGHCSASIENVYNKDFDENDDRLTLPHGCYVYQLLHGLNISRGDMDETFARLLSRCVKAEMCPCLPTIPDNEVGVLQFTPRAALTHFQSRPTGC